MQGFRSYSSYRKNRQQKSGAAAVIKFLLSALVIIFIIQVFAFQSITVNNDEMLPSLTPGERYVTLVYGVKNPFTNTYLSSYRSPLRGDIAVITPGYLRDESPFFHNLDFLIRMISFQKLSLYYTKANVVPSVIVRVIGLPGDTVSIESNTAYIIPSDGGGMISEFEATEISYEISGGSLPPGWAESDPFGANMESVLLGENEYFLLADNRMTTADSRYWGPVPKEAFQSHLLFRFWPLFRHKAE